MSELLVRGRIVFDPSPVNLSGARIFVRLEDTSYADGPARVIAEEILQELPARVGPGESVVFALHGDPPEPQQRCTVRVHVDMSGGAGQRINPGDYINTESYPVITHGYPREITVRVQRV